MARTRCAQCGATVDVCVDLDTGARVPLDIMPEAASDAPVYRIVGQRGRDQVVRVVTHSTHWRPGALLPDHRFDCPGHDAGLR